MSGPGASEPPRSGDIRDPRASPCSKSFEHRRSSSVASAMNESESSIGVILIGYNWTAIPPSRTDTSADQPSGRLVRSYAKGGLAAEVCSCANSRDGELRESQNRFWPWPRSIPACAGHSLTIGAPPGGLNHPRCTRRIGIQICEWSCLCGGRGWSGPGANHPPRSEDICDPRAPLCSKIYGP